MFLMRERPASSHVMMAFNWRVAPVESVEVVVNGMAEMPHVLEVQYAMQTWLYSACTNFFHE